MAENIGSLYVRLGLNLSELETGFVAAEQTVRQGIATLNRQQNIVKLKMGTDLAGLDAATDKAKMLEVQENALSQVLSMQQDKLRLATAAYNDIAQSKGANSAAAKTLEAAMERERLAVARLEAQLKSLAAQKVSVDTSQLQDNIARLNARVQNIKISADIDVSKLQDAGRAFDVQKSHVAALNAELDLQRQKLNQLRGLMWQAAQSGSGDSVQTLQIKSNVLQQIQQINQLETRLKELSATNISLHFRTESLKNLENNINQSIAQLNARIENVRVKTDIDVSKISSAASEFDRAKVQLQGLNHELSLQNQKLVEMKQALGTSVKLNGADNVKSINLQTEIQKQIAAIDQLKAKIKELNTIPPPKTNNLLSNYLNFKGNVTGTLNDITTAFNSLQGATSSADSAITAALGVIGSIPTPAGKAAAALASLPIIFKGVENSIVDMARAAAAAGDSTYVMSRGFQMSLADTSKFTSMCKTAGVEVNDLASTIKRVQQTVIRGGEDAKAEQWLKRYGESAFDAGGHLKNLNDMTLTLSRALKRAQADGNGMAFVLGTMRAASADAITAIEDAEGVYEQAAGLVKNGLMDATFAHEVQGNINALNLQASFMNASFTSALLPVANEIIPRLTERMGKLTQIIADNKDVIREFGRTAAEAFLKIEEVAEAVGGALARVGKFFVDLKKNPRQDEFVLKYQNDFSIETVDDLIKKEQAAAFDVIKANPTLYQQALGIYQPLFKAIDDAHKEIKRKNEELQKILAAPFSVSVNLEFERKALEDNADVLKSLRQARKYAEEADAILAKLNGNEYEGKKIDLEKWRTDLVREAELSAEERAAIEKLYSAKFAQIEQEHAKKLSDNIKEHFRNAADIEFSLTHTAFEKQLRDIELWKQAQREKAETAKEISGIVAHAAAKEADAVEREVQRIKGLTQSFEDEIFDMENSRYEADKRRALQKAQKALDEGVDADTVQRFLRDKFAEIEKKADESRKTGGDYTKAPEGTLQRGGNNIVVIDADQIVDDGLKRANIGTMVDENRIRAQVSQGLSQQAHDLINAAQATRDFTDAQKQLLQQTSGFQFIEGNSVKSNFAPNFQQIEGDKIFPAPTVELQRLGEVLQQATAAVDADVGQKIAQAESALADKLNQAAQDFPVDYFKSLADNMKGTSDILVAFSNDLIAAHGRLKDALANPPQGNGQMSTNGIQRLSTTTTQDLSQTQDLLVRKNREVPDIPPPQPATKKQGADFEFGFDHDLFGTLATTSATLIKLLQAAGAIAPHPAIKLGAAALGAAAGVAAGKGSFDATNEQHDAQQHDDRLKPYIETDLSALITPITAIDKNVEEILHRFQSNFDKGNVDLGSVLAEHFASLSNIERYAQEISQAVQTVEFPTEIIVTPLSNIAGNIQQILAALQNREMPDITVSPIISVNLGGAYVFDDALKKALVNDITSDVVVSIKDAVKQATNRASYGFGA